MDYYSVLDIEKSASQRDIKQAYRKLSMKFHPDRNNTSDAIKKFQEINEAHEVLSNENKRRQYDMGVLDSHGDVNMDDILSSLFTNFMGNVPKMQPEVHVFTSSHPFGGLHNMNMRHDFNMNKVFENGIFDNICENMMDVPTINKTLNINMEDCYYGSTISLTIERINQTRMTNTTEEIILSVCIPPGINNNEEIIFEKKGHIMNSKHGDVHVRILIDNHKFFEKNNLDLLYKHQITLKEALCGFRFSIEHLNGETLNLNHNGSVVIQHGAQKKISNYGFVNENHKGSLIIIFHVRLPETITNEQRTILEELL